MIAMSIMDNEPSPFAFTAICAGCDQPIAGAACVVETRPYHGGCAFLHDYMERYRAAQGNADEIECAICGVTISASAMLACGRCAT